MDNIIVKRKRKLNTINKKIKQIKTTRKNATNDVDTLHETKVQYFKKLQNVVLPKKKKELQNEKDNYKLKIIQQEIKDIEDRVEEIDYYHSTSSVLERYYNETNENKKVEIAKEYYLLIGLKKQDHKDVVLDTCFNCNSQYLIDTTEGTVCSSCGIVENMYIAEDLSFTQITENPSVLIKKVHYQKKNYFQEILKSLQGDVMKDVPDKVIDDIKNELIVNNITETRHVTHQVIQKILKKLNYSKYYKYKHHIVRLITKQKPLSIPKAVEEIINHMFDLIEKVWEEIKPDTSHSIFSLQHILYKIFQILNLNEYLQYISLSKDRAKVIKNELLWEKIVNHIVEYGLDDKYHYNIKWRIIPII